MRPISFLPISSVTDGFDSLGPCKVDVAKGTFGSLALEGTDYSTLPTDSDVMRIMPLGPTQPLGDWTVTDMRRNYVSDINNTSAGHTQFRLYFDSGTTSNKQVKWNSGDSVGNEPQLIVHYTP